MSLYPVIMAGGSGTRFWPLSRQRRPKQFLPLASERPLIADTLDRLPPLAGAAQTFVVCGKLHAPSVRELLPELPASRVVVEPVARNTAGAIGLAAIHVAHEDPQGVMLVLPSDHHIAAPDEFRATLQAAAEVAREGALVTIGIKPVRPETGYGYIQLGGALGERAGKAVRAVRRFVEKPDVETARGYVASGEYLWNAGIFALRADVILGEIARHLPKLDAALKRIAPVIGTPQYEATLEEAFPGVESISVDYGIMERAANIACVPGDFGWSDVGSFAALPEVRPADADGNVTRGEVIAADCKGCVIVSEKRLVAAVGLNDVIIVDAGDAILVVPKDRAQEVRKAVEALQKRGDKSLL